LFSALPRDACNRMFNIIRESRPARSRISLIFSIIAFAVLTACAKPTPSTLDSAKDDERYLKAKASYEPNLGENFWARLDMNLWSESRITTLN
jgi:hypothetical protein